MKILAIETSCDETAAAIVENGIIEIASVVASSRELHEKTGGVVPEIAARKQVEFIIPVLEETFAKAGWKNTEETMLNIDAVAVTVGPGLVGSLIVGVEAAKALVFAWNKPLIPVNHLVGHIYANFLAGNVGENNLEINFPAVALVVSGGHTDLVLMHGHGDLEYIGRTVDDAAGEAFDKTARLLGIGDYLGGVLLSNAAAKCRGNLFTLDESYKRNEQANLANFAGSIKLPRPKIYDNDFDFSFSGLKTAVKRLVETPNLAKDLKNPNKDSAFASKNKALVNRIACEFEDAVVEVLVSKTIKAVKKYGARCLLLGGGVAANIRLREVMQKEAEKIGINFFVPPLRLCGDNAVYIASAAFFMQKEAKDYEIVQPNPSLGIMG